MRTARLLALGLLLTLGSAGCARGDDDDSGVATAQSGRPAATASAGAATTQDPDAPLKFSKCMREQGITWFPDPDTSGRMTVAIPRGQDPKKFDAAHEACQKWAPDGGAGPTPDAAELEKVRQMAKCMRENGVPDFPDPMADGGLALDSKKLGTGPGDPTFDQAEQLCSKFLPKRDGASTGKHAEPAAA